ncbi:MAG: VOC family protein, partial [Rhodobacteraceae bacterium]|nr:VOC family protein [Paracoccaceae bacterium]
PILPSRDTAVTEAFYARIGFETDFMDADYLLMTRDGAEVHFFHAPALDPATNDHGAYLRPSDVDAFSDQVAALGLPHDMGFPRFQPAEDKPWGMREAALWDTDGNLIRAGQEIAGWEDGDGGDRQPDPA